MELADKTLQASRFTGRLLSSNGEEVRQYDGISDRFDDVHGADDAEVSLSTGPKEKVHGEDDRRPPAEAVKRQPTVWEPQWSFAMLLPGYALGSRTCSAAAAAASSALHMTAGHGCCCRTDTPRGLKRCTIVSRLPF